MTATVQYETADGIETATGSGIHDEYLTGFVTLYRVDESNIHIPRERVITAHTTDE